MKHFLLFLLIVSTIFSFEIKADEFIPYQNRAEVIDFIEQSRKKFKKLPPEDIAFPRSASDVVKYQAHSSSKQN